jgi:hypothetical protein
MGRTCSQRAIDLEIQSIGVSRRAMIRLKRDDVAAGFHIFARADGNQEW